LLNTKCKKKNKVGTNPIESNNFERLNENKMKYFKNVTLGYFL